MKKRLALATLAFAGAAVVTLYRQHSPEVLVERVVEESNTLPKTEVPNPHTNTEAEILNPAVKLEERERPSTLSLGDLSSKVDRSFSSARIKAGELQPIGHGFEASLTIDGVPVFGSRLIVDTRPKEATINIVPIFRLKANTPEHSRALGDQAKAVAKAESVLLEGCNILSLDDARTVWFPADDASNVVAAYAVEIYYVCGRTRTREDWIYADPSLEKIGRIKRRN